MNKPVTPRAPTPANRANAARLPDRRKVGHGRRGNPATANPDYSSDELEFMRAVSSYKQSSGDVFPSLSTLLAIARGLGYSKAGAAASKSA